MVRAFGNRAKGGWVGAEPQAPPCVPRVRRWAHPLHGTWVSLILALPAHAGLVTPCNMRGVSGFWEPVTVLGGGAAREQL